MPRSTRDGIEDEIRAVVRPQSDDELQRPVRNDMDGLNFPEIAARPDPFPIGRPQAHGASIRGGQNAAVLPFSQGKPQSIPLILKVEPGNEPALPSAIEVHISAVIPSDFLFDAVFVHADNEARGVIGRRDLAEMGLYGAPSTSGLDRPALL